MDAEGLLRHRVRGIVLAAEGRAEHLLEEAGREALEVRREAALEALEAVAEVERELTLALQRLSKTAERLAASPGAERDAPAAERDAPAEEPIRRGRFTRASMRERPVAALFAAAGDAEALAR
jgi:hypothetical protein